MRSSLTSCEWVFSRAKHCSRLSGHKMLQQKRNAIQSIRYVILHRTLTFYLLQFPQHTAVSLVSLRVWFASNYAGWLVAFESCPSRWCWLSSIVVVDWRLTGVWWFGGERKALDVDRWMARERVIQDDRNFNFVTPSQWIFLDFFGRRKEGCIVPRYSMIFCTRKACGIERDLFFHDLHVEVLSSFTYLVEVTLKISCILNKNIS